MLKALRVLYEYIYAKITQLRCEALGRGFQSECTTQFT